MTVSCKLTGTVPQALDLCETMTWSGIKGSDKYSFIWMVTGFLEQINVQFLFSSKSILH